MGVLDLFDLSGKVALVTGSNRGLGQAMALGLAEAGASVIGTGVGDDAETARAIQALGRTYGYHALDLLKATPSDLQALVAAVAQQMGRLDIVVNNAGMIRRAPLMAFTEADWDDVMAVNLKAMFFLSQAAAGVLPTGGKIINVASMLSYQGGVFVPSYTASKHGVMGITRAMANELAPRGINVNAIAPGYMTTDNTEAIRADVDRNASILARIPYGRWGTPDDLKGAAVFLASRASDYLNGTIIPVDGGWLAR
jgi:2-deoxy-D-gluconate 3-dehydrogenase